MDDRALHAFQFPCVQFASAFAPEYSLVLLHDFFPFSRLCPAKIALCAHLRIKATCSPPFLGCSASHFWASIARKKPYRGLARIFADMKTDKKCSHCFPFWHLSICVHPRESAVWFLGNFDYAAHMDSTGAILSEMHETLLKAFMRTYQQRYFRSTREVADLALVAFDGPSRFVPEENKIHVHSSLAPFSKLAKIAILHELIHSKLHKQNGDADAAEGARFQAEVKKLLEAGAYKGLL